MLENIKVYKRGDVVENINPFSIGYTSGETILLEVLDPKKDILIYHKLLKKDPLNKFKNQIKGWWFSEDGNYILVENEEELPIKISYENCYMDKVEMIECLPYHMKKDAKACKWKQLDLTIGSRWHSWREKDIKGIKKEIESILNIKIELEKEYFFNFLEIGEGKYLKLLELIEK